MELHQLKYFVAVAETGGFSRGAAACGVAQPSLSQQIKRLESSLGVGLFDRTARGVRLTDAGRELLPRARRILAETLEAQRSLGAEPAPSRLAFGAIPTIAPYIFPAILPALGAALPGCDLLVREDYTDRLIDGLRAGELDAAVLATEPEHAALVSKVVAEDPFLLALPRGHRLSRVSSVRVSELEDEAFIVLQEVHCLGRQIGELCRSRRVRPHVVSSITQLASALALVRAGLGVTIVPSLCAAVAGGVRTLPLRGASRSIVIAARRDRASTLGVEALHRVLADCLDRLLSPARGARRTSRRRAPAR